MPNWTLEQKQAIEEEGTNIIVSAGAGSGKTAVLTERVLRKLKNGMNINELLILTFTNAAAHEMKDRIRKEISKISSLKDQLNLIDTAYITTFDSYALSVVKKYHYLLDVSPNISIADNTLINLEKDKILDNIFNDLYEKHNPLFEKLINDLCVKDDKQIRNYILDIDDKLNLKIDKIKYIESYKTTYFNDKKINDNIQKYILLLREYIKDIKNNLEEIKYLVDGNYYSKIEEVLNPLFDSNTYEEIRKNLDIKLPVLPRNSDEELKTSKENLTKKIKDLKDLCSYENICDIKSKIILSFDYITIILDIIKELDSKINDFKKKNNLYEFADIIKMSIKVTESNTNVKEEIKNSFKEIMIDEYQDTNDLQEYFISLIANHNVYMVGDIKQSIYRFRNANPNIFKEKYDKYSLNTDGIKIDLNKNFRSRMEVINNINLIFNNLMDDYIGGADYKSTHQMIFGQDDYEHNKPNQDYNLNIFSYDYDKDNKYTKEEIEYFFVASDIKNKINNHYQIYDKDIKGYRDAKYSDFAILIDRGTTFDTAKKIFEYHNLPLTIYKDESITSAYDQVVIKNLILLALKELKQEYDDEHKYLFVSLARSFVFEYDDALIFKLIKDESYKDDNIIEKIKKVITNIQNTNITTFLNNIIEEFNLYENFIKLGNINDCMIRLEYLNNICKSLEQIGYTVYELGEYLKNLSEKNYEIRVSTDKDDGNGIRIMTIHKSKGLEFPICYFCHLYKEFNLDDLKDRFVYSNNYGLLAPYYENGIGKNIYFDLVKHDYLIDEISERIRLFYVALTRAKEKLIMVMPKSKKIKPFNLDNRIKYHSFSDFIYSLNEYLDKYLLDLDVENLNLSKDYNVIKVSNYKEKIETSSSKIKINNLNIKYDEIIKNSFSKDFNSIITKSEEKSRKLGLKFHEILEYLDFYNPNLEYIDDKFLNKKIQSFLDSELIKNSKDAKIYKEVEFEYKINNTSSHGIIDLIIEHDDHIDIIDYKLKNIIDENYKNQLNGYKNYINKIKTKEVNLYLYSILDEQFYCL